MREHPPGCASRGDRRYLGLLPRVSPLSLPRGPKPFRPTPRGVHCVHAPVASPHPSGASSRSRETRATPGRPSGSSLTRASPPGAQAGSPGPGMRTRHGDGSRRRPATALPAPERPGTPRSAARSRRPRQLHGPAPPPSWRKWRPRFRLPFRSAARQLPAGRWARVA